MAKNSPAIQTAKDIIPTKSEIKNLLGAGAALGLAGIGNFLLTEKLTKPYILDKIGQENLDKIPVVSATTIGNGINTLIVHAVRAKLLKKVKNDFVKEMAFYSEAGFIGSTLFSLVVDVLERQGYNPWGIKETLQKQIN